MAVSKEATMQSGLAALWVVMLVGSGAGRSGVLAPVLPATGQVNAIVPGDECDIKAEKPLPYPGSGVPTERGAKDERPATHPVVGPRTPWYWSSTSVTDQKVFAWTLPGFGATSVARRFPYECMSPRERCIVTGRDSDQRRTQAHLEQYVALRLSRPQERSKEPPIGLLGVRIVRFGFPDAPEQSAVTVASGQPVYWDFDPGLRDLRGERGVFIGYVYRADGTLVNAEVIRQGYGYADPNPALQHHAELIAAEQEARAQARGIWAPRRVVFRRQERRERTGAPGGGADASPTCTDWQITPRLHLQGGGTVGLLGLRTAVIGEGLNAQACGTLFRILEGQEVHFDFDPVIASTFGDVTAYVFAADGTSVNAELVRQGLAQLDPNIMSLGLRRTDELVAAEHEAREQRRGLWAVNGVVGLERHQTCRLGFEPDGHARCHVLRLTGEETVGLLGIRLPQWGGYLAAEVEATVARMTKGKLLRQEFDPAVANQYDCNLAYVFLPDGTFLNVELVRQGYAQADLRTNHGSLRYAAGLLAAEQEARRELRGVWGGTTVVSYGFAGHPLLSLKNGARITLTGTRVPRFGAPHDKALAAMLQPLLLGKPLQVATDPRLAGLGARAGVYATLADGTSLNAEMIREGYAYVDDVGRPYDLEERLREAEQDAREHERGLWAAHPVLGGSIRGDVVILVLTSGDTRYNPAHLTVQLLGLQPWLHHAQESGAIVSRLTTGKSVRLTFDPAVPQDPILTPVYAYLPDGTLLNAEIIRMGYGQVDDHNGTLKLQLAKELAAAEQEAKTARRGLGACQ